MGITAFILSYWIPLGVAALALLVALVLAVCSRRSGANKYWAVIARVSLLVGLVTLLLIVSAKQKLDRVRTHEASYIAGPSNLIANPNFIEEAGSFIGWTVNGGKPSRHVYSGGDIYIPPSLTLPPPDVSGTLTTSISITNEFSTSISLVSSVMSVQPRATFRYSLQLFPPGSEYSSGRAQVRILWLDGSLNVNSWHDSPIWLLNITNNSDNFYAEDLTAPDKARFAQMEIRSFGPGPVSVSAPKFSALGIHIEPNPNGTQGSLAFSFDWESAMGGAVHSKGEKEHDAQAAADHGLEMRQGADWLNNILFKPNNVRATFYATGYNLLDGNTEHRTFSGDPIYKWASPKNRWETDWWLTHKWYGDDPFGTYQTDPAWYFGDQTRSLLEAGHEIAPHTFGHIYVRGSNPQELSTDMDEWLKAAQPLGIITPTTFAFPWRSSNSLTADFYDVLYKRGIRAVTRLYELDLKDLYTVASVPVFPEIQVMPDFLLGAPSVSAGEEAGGAVIGLDKGLEVITETLARRGTTSFWTHPEQLADTPALQGVRAAWTGVVQAAAAQRDKGNLWIGTVAEITTYQRDVMSVTTSLDHGFLGMGGWKVHGTKRLRPGVARRYSHAAWGCPAYLFLNGLANRVSPT